MKKIKLLKSTVVDKKPAKKGSVVDASDATAFFLVNIKKAEYVESNKKKVTKKTYTRKADESSD